MPDPAMLDYFYGDEAEQFTFYRIPKVLFTDPSYRRTSSDAKILYGLMLDRMGLSVRNGWLDEHNRVFISLYIDADDLRGITNFNNVGTLACLGTVTAEANRTILMEIGEVVKNIQLEQVKQAKKSLAKQQEVSYNKNDQFNNLKRERSDEHERIDIHQPERLSDPEHRDGQQGERAGNPDPVRQGEGEIPDGTPESSLHGDAAERNFVDTSDGDRPSGEPAGREPDGGTGDERGRDGGAESRQSDGMGTADEQHPSESRGDHDGRSDLQLNTEPQTAGGEPAVLSSVEMNGPFSDASPSFTQPLPEWVETELLLNQKHTNTKGEERYNTVTVNKYFQSHPEMALGNLEIVAGPFGPQLVCTPIEGKKLSEQLAEVIPTIAAQYHDIHVETPEIVEQAAETLDAPAEVRNFSYTEANGKLYYKEDGNLIPVEVPAATEERIRGMIVLRDITRNLIEAQLSGGSDAQIAQLQKQLNSAYDSFTAKWGLLNSTGNKRAFEQDSSYCLLCSLEVLDEDRNLERKADMFSKRTINQEKRIDHVDTPVEALAVSIGERAGVDLSFMAEVLDRPGEER